jgi:hypothetical protein
MTLLYYLKGGEIENVETFHTWEDAYIFVTIYADENGFEMCTDGAVKKETNQFLKIYQ